MIIPISEARKRLPALIRRIRKDSGVRIKISVHDEVVAELRAAEPEPEPGAAAKALLECMKYLRKHRGQKSDVSTRTREVLYGIGGIVG
jgi:antitoxin (DNA-binding transcriptional repressor) of toxin-antitoxin stability system